MEKTVSIKTLRRRKMLLVLPLLALPFITIIFWSLGGGKMHQDPAKAPQKGFNLKLPNANLNEGLTLDKMSYYDQAALDSAKHAELIRKDPNYLAAPAIPDSARLVVDSMDVHSKDRANHGALKTKVFQSTAEARVYKKLEALQQAINKKPSGMASLEVGESETDKRTPLPNELTRLEEMMYNSNTSEPDLELQQLSGMLENILDIQYPERAQEKMRKASQIQRGQVFSLTSENEPDQISFFQGTEEIVNFPENFPVQNGFYSIDQFETLKGTENAVVATVYETQTVVNGSIVKLKLVNDIFINGTKIPKDNFIYGTAALKGERLTLKIGSVRYKNSLFPVNLSVYDMDGLSGIYIPGAINRDVAKASADRSVNTLGVTTMDDSWGAQAAGAGIEVAKTLFSKKVKLIKVVVKAGYQVLLRDENQKQNDSH